MTAQAKRDPTTREVADALLTYNECLEWAARFNAVPFNQLALATVAAKAAGPVLVMRSLFALAAEVEDQRTVLREIVGEAYNLLTQGESPTQRRHPSAQRIYDLARGGQT